MVLGAGVAHRVGTATPHPGLHGPPERHRLRHHVGPVDVDQHRVASRRRRGSPTAGRCRSGPAGPRRAAAAAASGSTSACRPTRRWGCGRRCGCSRARSPAGRGRACPRRAGRAGAGSTRRSASANHSRGCGDWLVVGRYWKNSCGSPATPVARRDSTSRVLPLRCEASTRYAVG